MIGELKILFDGTSFRLSAAVERGRERETYELFRKALPGLAGGRTLAEVFGVDGMVAAAEAEPIVVTVADPGGVQ